jgi:hypothetical protein
MAFTVSMITLSIALLVIIAISTKITNYLGEDFYKGTSTHEDIYDIIHTNTPDLHAYEYVVDIIPFLLILSFFFIPIGLFKEFAGKFLLLMLIRAVTTVSTILPRHGECKLESTWYSFLRGQCYEKIFSGHMTFTLLASLIYLREKMISPIQFWATNMFEFLAITMTRAHYTVDLIVAIVITYLVYEGDYHVFHNVVKEITK